MQNSYKDKWNQLHKEFSKNKNNIMKYDDWLEEFKDIIDNVESEIIDLGCGVTGNNTLYLMGKDKKVISCDFAEEALNVIKKHIPGSNIVCFDMTEKFPFKDNFTELVIADLSLHYFSRITTESIINEIRRVLKPAGYLIFRVNSTNSTEYMKLQNHKEQKIDDKFYFSKGIEKRFFSEKDLKSFFKNWKIDYMKQGNMNRWNDDKIVWKCLVKNNK